MSKPSDSSSEPLFESGNPSIPLRTAVGMSEGVGSALQAPRLTFPPSRGATSSADNNSHSISIIKKKGIVRSIGFEIMTIVKGRLQ